MCLMVEVEKLTYEQYFGTNNSGNLFIWLYVTMMISFSEQKCCEIHCKNR